MKVTRPRNRATVPLIAVPARGAVLRLVCLLAGSLGVSAGLAQTSGRGLTVGAAVDGSTSYVVNSRNGGRDNGDFVAEVRPSVRLDSRSGRVVGSLSYAASLSHHSNQADASGVQNQLAANLSAEAVERWLYVDATASVSQQVANAYGQQTVGGSTQDNPNRVEVGTISVSPYVRGSLFGGVSYEVRLTGSATNGRRSVAADSTQYGGSMTLSSVVSGTALGWALVGSTQTVDFRAGRESTNDRVTATLTYALDADVSLALRGGQESNDVASLNRTSYNNWGAGVTWRPSPRTRMQFDTDERFFGKSHRLVLEHRLTSTSFTLNSVRDISGGLDGNNTAAPITQFQLLDRIFASVQPDPALREILVLDELRAKGLDPNATAPGGFFNPGVTVTERQDLTVAYSARRLTLSAQAYATKSRVIDAGAVTAPNEDVRQQGYTGSASYRLNPNTSVALTGSRLLTKATATLPGTELKSLSLSATTQLGRRTSGSAAARYTVFNSSTEPYREAAISASLSHRF
jgi:uncharacterized protein (PEP-CTERM system associated)